MARKKSKPQTAKVVELENEEIVKPQTFVSMVETKWKLVLFLFGFVLYANTATFDYALDDKIVIVSNQITTQGFGGIIDHFRYDLMDGFWAMQYGVPVEELNKSSLVAGGRYRPLSLVTFCIEWELFGENPGISHFVNALLYGVLGMVLFSFLMKLFPIKSSSIWKNVPFWLTLLFLAHPLHVEVVANIKGRDEILNLLFGLISLSYIIDYARTKEVKSLLISSAMLFVSLLSKETTVAFIALGPLLLFFFDFGSIKEWKWSFGGLLASGVLYNLIRFAVVGSSAGVDISEVMNDSFLYASESERIATIFLTIAIYAKLLIVPYPLTHDYYPFHLPFLPDEQQYATWSDLGVIVGVLIILGLLFVFVKGLKSKSIYAYSILFFFGTFILVSNVLFPIGVFMNDRFMFIPSVGVVIAVGVFLSKLLGKESSVKNNQMAIGALSIFILVFSVLTVKRSAAWESDSVLALTDVQVSLGSAKVNMAAGDALIRELEGETNQEYRQELLNETYGYLKKSLEIHPKYFPPLDLLGKMYFESGDYNQSIEFYVHCVERKPGDTKFIENIFIIGNRLASDVRFDEAVSAYNKALEFSPNNKRYLLAAAEVSARDLRNPSQALPYMEKAYSLYPEDVDAAEKLGITYAMLQRYQDAINMLDPLLLADPNNASVMKNLGIAYYQAGQVEKGTALMKQSETLEGKKN
jgi:tetratricopeptide (TPR) repeat protein